MQDNHWQGEKANHKHNAPSHIVSDMKSQVGTAFLTHNVTHQEALDGGEAVRDGRVIPGRSTNIHYCECFEDNFKHGHDPQAFPSPSCCEIPLVLLLEANPSPKDPCLVRLSHGQWYRMACLLCEWL
jgi:hypothetical protein